MATAIDSFQSMCGNDAVPDGQLYCVNSISLYTIALEFGSLADAIWTVLAYTLCYLGIVFDPALSDKADMEPQGLL